MTDFSKAVEVAKDIYWVGTYLENDPFQCHPYLIVDGENSILIDPGSMLEYDQLVKKVSELIPMKNIKYIIAHHQDPDLCASIPQLEKVIDRDDLNIITHRRSAALIKHYGIKSDFLYIDEDDFKLQMSDNRVLKFITTPYAHAPGAFITYDKKTKSLFTSDIFGALEDSWSFYADENYFEYSRRFHEEYMPSREIFNFALSKIEELDVERILPQHGSIIEKKYIPKLIEKYKKLECGMYISSEYKTELLRLKDSLEIEKNRYKENLEHLKTIIDMQDNMIIVTHENEIIECNHAFLSFFNKKSIEEFESEGNSISSKFIDIENERYLSSTKNINDWAEYVIKNPQKEHRVVMKDFVGYDVTFRIQVKDLMTKKMHKHYVTTFIDISKEVQELDLLHVLSKVDEIHYCIYDKQQQKYKISKSLSKMLNIAEEDNVNNLDFKKYINNKDCIKIVKSANKKSDRFELLVHYENKNISLIVHSYQSHIENTLKQVYIFIDISAIKEAEVKSKQRDTLMFQQSKMAQMGEMISMIAHQWRQPINAISASSIKLSLSNTLDKLTHEGIEEHSEFVQKQCQKMSNVIDSFMNYSNNRGEEKEFKIIDVIKTINDFVSVQYTAHNIKVIIENDASIDDPIFGREDMLEQVLLNLFSNSKDAFERSDSDDIEKCICVKHTKPREIVVEDNAGGIEDSVMDKLFTPYFTTKEQGKGTGLGLYMGKRIMNEHFNGDLTYKKEDNRSYFTLTMKERS